MTESGDTPRPDDAPDSIPEGFDVVGEEPAELDSPRRAASAEFVVRTDVGAASALRDAMDPANQSLADALRLSFRVLQIVILILIVLFLGSSVVTVQDTQGGVLTRWGKIVPVPFHDSIHLDSGFNWGGWPYPVGEFVLFESANRNVQVRESFLPNSKIRGVSIQQLVERIRPTDRYRAGVDGSVLTRDGDLAHIAFDARYEIVDSVKFVTTIPLEGADAIVRRVIEHATIRVVSTVSLRELLEATEDVRLRVQQAAQQSLDDIDCGMQIRQITMPEPARPPYQIVSTFGDLQKSRVDAEGDVQRARRSAEEMRNRAAGERWREIVDAIEAYEIAVDQGDDDAAVVQQLAIDDWLDNKAQGVASQIVSDALSYQSRVESTLGNEAKRFASLLPTYREHPELVIRQRWYQATAFVMGRPDAELYWIPPGVGKINISLSRLDELAQFRRDLKIDRSTRQTWEDGFDPSSQYIRRAGDYTPAGRAGRRLDVRDGEVKGQAEERLGQPGAGGGN